MRRCSFAPLVALLVFGHVAAADDAAIARCRTLTEAAARLACYDAIELRPAPAAAAPTRPLAERFGLDKLFREGEADAVDSHINGDFDGWVSNQRITLANGQVWQIIDGSQGVVGARNPKVRVRRGALGAYYLEVAGTNNSPRVRRVE